MTPIFVAAPPDPDPGPDREVLALQRRLARVAALLDEPGHITRAELRAALADTEETP